MRSWYFEWALRFPMVGGVRQSSSGQRGPQRFAPPDFWWVSPPLTDFIYFVLQSAFGTRYTFDFPFCRSCIPPFVQLTPIRPIRLDEDLAVFRGTSQSLLNLLPPMPPDVAAERIRGLLQRKFEWLLDNV